MRTVTLILISVAVVYCRFPFLNVGEQDARRWRNMEAKPMHHFKKLSKQLTNLRSTMEDLTKMATGQSVNKMKNFHSRMKNLRKKTSMNVPFWKKIKTAKWLKKLTKPMTKIGQFKLGRGRHGWPHHHMRPHHHKHRGRHHHRGGHHHGRHGHHHGRHGHHHHRHRNCTGNHTRHHHHRHRNCTGNHTRHHHHRHRNYTGTPIEWENTTKTSTEGESIWMTNTTLPRNTTYEETENEEPYETTDYEEPSDEYTDDQTDDDADFRNEDVTDDGVGLGNEEITDDGDDLYPETTGPLFDDTSYYQDPTWADETTTDTDTWSYGDEPQIPWTSDETPETRRRPYTNFENGDTDVWRRGQRYTGKDMWNRDRKTFTRPGTDTWPRKKWTKNTETATDNRRTEGSDEDTTTTDTDTNPFESMITGLHKGLKFHVNKWMSKSMKTLGGFQNIFENIQKMKTQMSKTMHKMTTNIPKTPCEFCNTVISYLTLSNQMGINTGYPTQEQIRATVDELCSKLTGFETITLCKITKTKLEDVLRLVMNNTNSTTICEVIGITECTPPTETFTQIETSTTTRNVNKPDCNNMCDTMTRGINNGLTKWTTRIGEVKKTMLRFCKENNIVTKCEIPLRTLEKMTEGVRKVETENMKRPTTTDTTTCKCFDTQTPITMTETTTDCTLCKTLATVMEERLKGPISHLNFFIDKLETDICSTYPTFEPECKMITETMKRLVEEELSVTTMCEEFKFCTVPSSFVHRITSLKNTFGKMMGVSPFLLRGSPMKLFTTRKSEKCQMCKRCMTTVQESMENVEDTKQMIPVMRTTLQLMCTTMTDENEQVKTVCEHINKEMGKVEEMLLTKKTEDGYDVCTAINLC